jgi:hypothetical protein
LRRKPFDSLAGCQRLLSLAWSNHPHHNAAHAWFTQNASGGWATCLLTQIGLLRLSLNPQIVGIALSSQPAHFVRGAGIWKLSFPEEEQD